MYKPLNKSLFFIFIGLLFSLFSFKIPIVTFRIPVGLIVSFVYILIGCYELKDRFKWAKKLFIIEIVTVCSSLLISFAIDVFISLNKELLDACWYVYDGIGYASKRNYYTEIIRNHATEVNVILSLNMLVEIVTNIIHVYVVYKLYCEVIDKVQVRYNKLKFKIYSILIVIGQTMTSVFGFLHISMFVAHSSADIRFIDGGRYMEIVGSKENIDFYNMTNKMCMYAVELLLVSAIGVFVFIILRLIASYKVYKDVRMLEVKGYRYGMAFENSTKKVNEISGEPQKSDEPKSFL